MCPFSILAFYQPTTVDKEPEEIPYRYYRVQKTSTFVLVLRYKLLIKVSLRQL